MANPNVIVFEGDLLTYGYGGSEPYYEYITLPTFEGQPFISYGNGVNGATLYNMEATAPTTLNPHLNPDAGMNVVVVWGGTNDIVGAGFTPQYTYQELVQFCQQEQAEGWTVIVATMIDRVGAEPQQEAYNSLIRANWTSFASGIADVAANPILGAQGASLNTAYFIGDGIHLNDTGYQVVASIVQASIDELVLGQAPAAAANSSIVANSGSISADGVSTTTLTVTVKDANSEAVGNSAVTLSASGSGNTFGVISGFTNSVGVFTTTLTSVVAQTETITATEGSAHETVSVTFAPTTVTWATGVSGNWQDAMSWTPGIVPGAGNAVFITAPGAYTVSDLLDTTVFSIATSENATLDITAGIFTANAGTGTASNAGTIQVDGGALLEILPSTVTNTGSLNVSTGGAVNLDGTKVVNTGGVVNVDAASTIKLTNTTVSGGTLSNVGTVDVTGGSTSTLNGARVANTSGAVNVDAASALELVSTTITGGTLSNVGVVDVTGGTISTLEGVSVTDTGGGVTVTAPFGPDGNGFANKSTPTTSASVTLTTSNANDVVVLDIVQNGTAVSSVSDVAGLNWHQRAVAGAAPYTIYEYYAIAPNALTADAITVNFAGAASYVDLNAFGVSGANTSSPFDSNVSVPAGPAASAGSITTSNTNDLIIAGYRFGSNAAPAVGSGWTTINASGGYYLSEYKIVSATQAGLVATASTADQTGGIIDAIAQAGSITAAITVDTGSTLALNNTTITGGTLSNVGVVDVTGGTISTLEGVSVTDTGGGVTVTAPFGPDGNGFANKSTPTTSASVTLTTSNANDVVVLDIVQNGTAVSSVSDVAGLNWHQRAVAGAAPYTIYEYYAIAPNALTADAITVNFAGAASYVDLNAFGVSGANTSSPFDSNVSVPAGPAASVGSITTSNTNDLIIAGYRFGSNAAPAVGSGWTTINASGGYYLSEYKIVSATQAGLVATASTADQTGGIIDAIAQASSPAAAEGLVIDVASTLDLNNTTITGGTLSNSGTVDVTGGAISTLNGVAVTNTSAIVLVDAGSTLGLNKSTIGGGTLSNTGTVDATGTSALDDIAVANSGLLEVTSGTLTIDPSVLMNLGTLKATTGGAFDLDGINVNNVGGMVEINTGSTLDLTNTTITGGTLKNSGIVDVTGGAISTLNGVSVTNTSTANNSGSGTVTAPLALDGNGFANKSAPTTSASVTLTTTHPNDVIILDIVQNGTAVSSVSDVAGLSWHQRAVAGTAGQTIYEYYAIAANALSADVITVNFAGAAGYVDLNAFGVSGANTSSPFDSNVSVPASPAASAGSITTSNANDLIIAGYRLGSNAAPAAGSGWTTLNASGNYYLSEYQIVSATQAGLVATASTADQNGGIIDAIQAGSTTVSASTAVKIDAGSTLDLTNTTINGGSLSNSGTVDLTGTSTLNGVAVTNTSGTVTVDASSTLDLTNTTITGGTLKNSGIVDVTGGAISTLNGVSVTNTGGTMTTSTPLALDGNGFANKSAPTTSASVTLTTTHPNDVIVLDIVQNGTAVSSVSDVAGLNWHQRAVAGTAGQTIYEYYAIAANALSADVITVNFAGAAGYVDLNAFGVSGANTSSPFDSNVSVPASPAASAGSITTSNANDLIIAGYRFGSNAAPAAGSGWTAINASGNYYLSEYQIVSATQAGLVATASTGDENGGIIDAIAQAPASAPPPTTPGVLTVDASSTLDLTNTTINGGSLSNSGTVDLTGTSTLNGVAVTNTSGTVTVDASSTLDLTNTTITGGTLKNSGIVDVTGGAISTLNGVSVTNTGGTMTTSTPLALDGNGFANKSAPTTSASVTLTTTHPNDVIVLDIVQNGTAVSSVSDVAGLNWHQRAVAGTAGQTIYEYYAIAANALSADVITVNFAGAAGYVDLNAFGVSGANTSSPFDSNVSVPASPAASAGSITTSNANDLIIAGYRFGSNAAPAAGSGWTAINASGNYYLSEYQIVSATQAGLVATASTGDENGGIIDAIQAGSTTVSASTAVKIDAGSTLDLTNTTINGGSLSNSGTVDLTGTSTLNGVAVTNSGTLEATSGILNVSGPVTNTGNLLANGGTLDIAGAVTGSGTATISGTNSVLEFGAASAENITFSAAIASMLKLDNPSSFTGTVAGLATGDSIDLTNFLFSGGPTIAGVTGTGAVGTTTNVTVHDQGGAQSVTLQLLNQSVSQFAVDPTAYSLVADNSTPNHGTLFQLAAHG